jgi:hypothetical protein
MAELEAVLIPRATYRLQFHKGIGFDHAATLAPYLVVIFRQVVPAEFHSLYRI